MPYAYIEDYVLADVAFLAEGSTLEELFKSSWEAALFVLLENPEVIQSKVTRLVDLQDARLDFLLYDFLEQLIFFKDAESIFLRIDELKIQKAADIYRLIGTLFGEAIDPERHALGVDVKAITFHGLEVKCSRGVWQATVVLDI